MFHKGIDVFGQAAQRQPERPHDFIVVSDLFIEDYVGGAELTTQALIDIAPGNVRKLRARELTLELIKFHQNATWIICNIASIDANLIPTLIANVDYVCVNYDYGWCSWRSVQKHELMGNERCECERSPHGSLFNALYDNARSVWFMSDRQRRLYEKKMPNVADPRRFRVLSSVFSESTLAKLTKLRDAKHGEHATLPMSDEWAIIGSDSWIKGTSGAIEYCKTHQLNSVILGGMSYDDMLQRLAQCKGLVYLPPGDDTCPRSVIEAKLLGLELVLNENVQHRDESWFLGSVEDTERYLASSAQRFWNRVVSDKNFTPKISGYTTTRDCIDQDYPWEEAIESVLTFADEVIVVDGSSVDGTWERLLELSKVQPKIKPERAELDWSSSESPLYDGRLKARAKDICTGDFCWQFDVDEIVHPVDSDKIKALARNFPRGTDVVALPVIEYWGNHGKVRADVQPWKWRLLRNKPEITHGIPDFDRQESCDGSIRSKGLSDGCFVINRSDGSLAHFLSFMSTEIEQVRRFAPVDPKMNAEYEQWFNKIVSGFPSVYHFSWYNIVRKIKCFRRFWGQNWAALAGQNAQDPKNNNKFFDKDWSDVSESEISDLAKKLRDEMGGWIFHERFDFSSNTLSINVDRPIPPSMAHWCSRNNVD